MYRKNNTIIIKTIDGIKSEKLFTTEQSHSLKIENNIEKSITNTSLINDSIKYNALGLEWFKIRKQGVGLLNLGNNCYLNATLQCLAYTAPFSQWLLSRPHSPACKFKQMKGFCSLCEVERIICDIFNNSGNGYAKPNTLCFNIKSIITFLFY